MHRVSETMTLNISLFTLALLDKRTRKLILVKTSVLSQQHLPIVIHVKLIRQKHVTLACRNPNHRLVVDTVAGRDRSQRMVNAAILSPVGRRYMLRDSRLV